MVSQVDRSAATRASELFQLLRDGQSWTRANLVHATGLSRPTVAQRLDQLIEVGLVAPVEDAASTGGRPSAQVAFNPQARVVVGVDLGVLHARIALLDLSGRVLASASAQREISQGPQSAIEWIIARTEELLAQASVPASKIAGIGVGVPGPVEFSTGRPINPPIMPGWDRFDIPRALRPYFGPNVLVDNDVNIMAWGEQYSHWRDVQDLIFVKVSSGIGAGVISGGSLRRGAHGAAGDIGHVTLSRAKDVICTCGNQGCLEAVASGRVLARELSTSQRELRTPHDVVQLAKTGDLDAIQAVRRAGRDVGEVLATAVSLLNPSVIVIGGTMAGAGEHLLAGVREVVYRRTIPLSTEHLTITPSKSIADAAIIGAGRLAIESALSVERVAHELH